MSPPDSSIHRHYAVRRWRQYASSRLLIASQIEQFVQEILAGDHDDDIEEAMHPSASSSDLNLHTPLGRFQVPIMPPAISPCYRRSSSPSQVSTMSQRLGAIASRQHSNPGPKLLPPRSRQSTAPRPPAQTVHSSSGCATQLIYPTSNRRESLYSNHHLENPQPINHDDNDVFPETRFTSSPEPTTSSNPTTSPPEMPPLHREPSLQESASSMPIRQGTHDSPQNRRLHGAFTQQLNLETLSLESEE